MKCTPIVDVVLGPNIQNWLWPRDLQFPESGHAWGETLEVPAGLITDAGWVVFLRRQVVLVVPDEVHSYWHVQADAGGFHTLVWHVQQSAWLASFDPRHLTRCMHFVLDLRDHVVEVICEELLFGALPFELEPAIEKHPALADAYYWRAMQYEKVGDTGRAQSDLARVAASPGAVFQAAAQTRLSRAMDR